MFKSYQDFEVVITRTGKRIYADLGAAPGDHHLRRRVRIKLPSDRATWTGVCQGRKTEAQLAESGHRLFKALIKGKLAEKRQACLTQVKQENTGLRLRFSYEPGTLTGVPLELLYDQPFPEGKFLALDPRTPVVHSPRYGGTANKRDVSLPLRMLAIVANPNLEDSVDPIRQKTSLEKALSSLIADNKLIVDYLGLPGGPDADFDTVHRTLFQTDYPYDIVHFIGHGSRPDPDSTDQEGRLFLVDRESGQGDPVRASDMASILADSGVRLVVMLACEGAHDGTHGAFQGVAQQCVAWGLPAVLAMQCQVSRDVAVHFCEQFYDYWLDKRGLPIEHAVTRARRSLHKHFGNEAAAWVVPVLFIRQASTEVLTIKPDRPRFSIQLKRGGILLERGNIDEAVDELTMVYEAAPDITQAHSLATSALVAQAQARKAINDEDGALKACERALRISPDRMTAYEIKTSIWIERGDRALEKGDLDKALDAYSRAKAMEKVKELEKRKPAQQDSFEQVQDHARAEAPGATQDPWRPGFQIDGGYEIERMLASTETCEIYRAKGLKYFPSTVVVKRLKPEKTKNEYIRERFEREVAVLRYALSQVEGEVVLRLLRSCSTDSQDRYFVTEFADKGSLEDYLKERPKNRLSPMEALEMAQAICQGLEAIHGLGIIHRDLKPGNVFLFSRPDGSIRTKLADFSIASIPKTCKDEDTTKMQFQPKKVGFMGTYGYAAPEQLSGQLYDHRSDLYSFAVVLFETLTGRTFGELPFRERIEPSDEALASILEERGVPQEFSPILQKALRKLPEDRYQSAGEMQEDLDSVKASIIYNQAISHCSRWKWQAAVEAFEELIDLDPNFSGMDIAAKLAAARTKLELEEKHNRIRALMEQERWTAVLQLVADSDHNCQGPDGDTIGEIRKRALYAQARKLEEDDPERAYHLLYELYKEDSGYEKVAELCAAAAFRSGTQEGNAWEQQIKWLERVIEIDPAHREGYTQQMLDGARLCRAEELLEGRDQFGAIGQLQHISQEAPEYQCAQSRLVKIYTSLGDQEFRKMHLREAREYCKTALAIAQSLKRMSQ
jgi:serine/threonine protein kinase